MITDDTAMRAEAPAAVPAWRRMARKPDTAVPAIAAAGSIVLVLALGARPGTALLAAAITAIAAWGVMGRITAAQATAWAAGRAGVALPWLLRWGSGLYPDPPEDAAAALELIGQFAAELRAWPEELRAAEPGDLDVRWDAPGREALPAGRAEKMRLLRCMIWDRARLAGVLQQFPPAVLVASDGAVIEILGGRTGALAAAGAAPDDPDGE